MADLCNLESFYTPYLAPYAPFIKEDLKDFVIKDSLVYLKTRPKSIPNKNRIRLKGSKKESFNEEVNND